MLGGPFEGSEGGENPERETESLEELRNRFRTKYPEAEQLSQDQSRTTEQHNLSQTTGWEDRERLDEQQFSDEKRLENELEILQKEIIEKYPSTEEPASKNGADSKIKNHIDGIGGEEAGEGDSSKQHLQEDPGVNSGERDRSYEEKLSQTKSKLEQDLPEEHKIEGGNTSEASDYRPRTDSVVPEDRKSVV